MDSRNIFWGLICKPGKRYETEVQEAFRMTKACIDPSSCKDGKVTSLMVECDNGEEFIIANLSLKSFNESLDIAFNEGEKICFKVDGTATVHLTGNLLEDSPPGDMFDMETDSDDVEESEVEEAAAEPPQKRKKDLVNGKAKKAKKDEGDTTVDTTLGDLDDTENFAEEEDSDDDEDDDDDDDEEDDSEDTSMADTTAATEGSDDSEDDSDDEEEEEKEPEVKKTVKATPKGDKKAEKVEKTPKPAEKKEKQEVKTPKPAEKKQEMKTPKQDANAQKEGAVPKTPKETKTPKAEAKTPKQEAKTPKQEGKTPKVDAKTPKEEGKSGKEVQTPGKTPKRTMKGGIQVEDVKEGSGPECKPGNMVGMYYEGRLKSNNKKFDGLKDGKPFKFKLGSGQVIKGWDIGVLGMKVGGKRKLIIPPKLGYGTTGAPPDIPPNSTLVFDIECKFVK